MVQDGDTEMRQPEPKHMAARRSFRRLFAWYAVVLSIFGGVWWLLSALPPGPDSDATNPLTGDGALLTPSEMFQRVTGAAVNWTAALLQMLAALLLVIPLAVVYVRTRTRAKYDHTLVQTVLVLPVAIAAVLMMVRHSLALAFGLAGVVGAVRFRSNLRES
jgi:flagellar biogenesis protein FliO